MNTTPSRKARQAAGLTLPKVARITGLSFHTIRQWESANRYPFHQAETLSRIYDCSIDVFLPQGNQHSR